MCGRAKSPRRVQAESTGGRCGASIPAAPGTRLAAARWLTAVAQGAGGGVARAVGLPRAGAVAPKAPGPAPTLFQPYDSVFTALNLTVSSPTRWPRPHRRRDEASFVGLNRQAPGHAALRAPKQHRRPSFGRTANPRTDTLSRDRGRYTLTWEEPLNRRIHITSGAHNIGYPGGATQLRFLRGKEVFTMEQVVNMKAITIWPISK